MRAVVDTTAFDEAFGFTGTISIPLQTQSSQSNLADPLHAIALQTDQGQAFVVLRKRAPPRR